MTLPPCDHRRLIDAGFACDSPKVHLPVVTAATCGRCPWRVVDGQPITPPTTPAKPRWQGLGDVVASVTHALGFRTCGPCDKRRRWLNRVLPFQILATCAVLLWFGNARADGPVFEYHRRYAMLIVFHEHTCVSAYGLDADDRLVMRFAAFTGSDEPWHGRTLRIEYHGCYDVQGVSYPWRARAWLTADTLILWDRLGSDPLPGTIWAWPHLGVEHPSPAEVLARSPERRAENPR